MCRLCAGDSLVDPAIEGDLKDLLHRLSSEVRLDRAVLFGSFSRNDFSDHSDVDLLLLGSFRGRFTDRIAWILERYRGDRPLEVLPYTQEEFQRMLDEERPFLLRALREGTELI